MKPCGHVARLQRLVKRGAGGRGNVEVDRLAQLNTAIMVAGRSGSLFVAEIGEMKARDEGGR